MPRPLSRSKAGTVTVTGVAWAQHRGIDRVQVRTSGSHTITVRATERGGRVQTEKRAGTVPDGAGGWPSVVVTID